ncbi:MAG TPA: class A beta-lactamase [Burkholderiales bacterium]|nr:class A beta-lactamase [Burkholderiales bacterium]
MRPAAVGLIALLALTSACAAAQDGLARLQSDIENIAREAGGTVGVAVRHIETGRELYVNRSERFPMGSAVKITLAVQLLTLVDEGKLSLEKIITLQRSDLRGGSGILVNRFDESQPAYSLLQLLEVMLIHSDNTATDVIWREIGGREAVAGRLVALGVNGISVDRPIRALLAAARGPEVAAAFFKDQRDTATPEAMTQLVIKIWRREALSAESTALLLSIMQRCATGMRRLPGMLPSETRVFRKTGTLSIGVTNDVGIIELPGGAGNIAIAVMVRESQRNLATQERTIAQIAWAAYRYFR